MNLNFSAILMLILTIVSVTIAGPLDIKKRDLPPIVPLTFYQDCGFNGNTQTYQLIPLNCFNLPTNWASLISGINISSNICYIVYNNANCDGNAANSQRFCGPVGSFCNTPYNDHIQSLIIA